MLQIERALPADSDYLYSVTIESKSKWSYSAEFLARWAEVLKIPAEYIRSNHVYKAVRDGQIVAWYSLVEHNAETLLDHLWVLPVETGKGVGRALFEHAAALSRQIGASRMVWESDPNAVPFYQHLGARVTGQAWTIMDRYVPLMELILAA
jgi:GNAT superfamily N-acetyltransferase